MTSGSSPGSDRDHNNAAELRDRPAPWAPAPEGFHFETYNPPEWVTPPQGAGRCRFFVAGRRACGEKPAASLLRNSHAKLKGTHTVAWDYCADHLYGGWMEDGKVTRWRLVKDEA